MTTSQEEWYTSQSPLVLLDHELSSHPRIRVRKLRLWMCALLRKQLEDGLPVPTGMQRLPSNEERRAKLVIKLGEQKADNLPLTHPIPQPAQPRRTYRALRDNALEAARDLEPSPPHFIQAQLLREVFGDIHHPVPSLYRVAKLDNSGWSGLQRVPNTSWLTEQVVRLAKAAYHERTAQGWLDEGCLLALSDALEEAGCPAEVKCTACNGKGGELLDSGGTEPWGEPVDSYEACTECNGSGKQLNPLLAHLRTKQQVTAWVVTGFACPRCNGKSVGRSGLHFDHVRRCPKCGISWEPGKEEWVTYDVPHMRGCWVVDLLLGKE